MFFCESCKKKNDWSGVFRSSHGPCEICHQVADCYDVPSKYLSTQVKPMTNISDFSIDELENEISKRKAEANKKPEPLREPRWTDLVHYVDTMLSTSIEEECWDEDNYHYLFEEVMTTIYGANFFNWFNKQDLIH